MKQRLTKILFTLTLALLGLQAHALTLTPGFIDGAACVYDPDPNATCWSGTDPKNPKAGDIMTLTGATDLVELYKAEVPQAEGDPVTEEGAFAPYYTTEFFNTPLDPMDATITHDLLDDPSIGCPDCFLLVKDGDQDPNWYVFDIGFWNGTDAIFLEDFWPNQGAISHISIFGKSWNVPEPAPLALISLGLLGIGLARKRTA